MSRIRAVVLDFDGVIAESNAIKNGAFEEFFALYPAHQESMRAFHQEHHAKPRRFKFTYYAQELSGLADDTEAIEQMAAKFSTLLSDKVIRCAEVPGARQFLEEFHSLVPLYISSMTPHEELLRIVEARGLMPFIKQAFGNPPHAKDVVVRQVLAWEGLQPQEVVFVGDSASDYEVALNTGLVFMGRDSGQVFPDTDLTLYADLYEIADAFRPLI